MDDCLAQVAIDFGGRNWLIWEADFKREMIGKMPTEMMTLNRLPMGKMKHTSNRNERTP